jgi:TolB-like protein
MQNFTSKEILTQLARVLASSQLSGSNVLSEFLNFIVRETLNGRGDELKEYTIGVHALKKESDFNPQLDSIVRIHAGRLRRALKEYYYEEGSGDRLMIIIPKGSYVPSFELREMALITPTDDATLPEISVPINSNGKDELDERPAKIKSNHKSSIAVLPFKKIGHGEMLKYFTQGIGEYISTELTLFQNLKVVSYYSGGQVVSQYADIRTTGIALGADYILTGSVHLLEGAIRLYVQLNVVASGDQLWAHTFEQKKFNEKFGEFQVEVVDKILADVAGMNGIIVRYEIEKKSVFLHESPDGEPFIYWYRQYAHKFDKPTITKAKKYYEEVIKREPDNAMAFAYLSEIISGETLLLQPSATKRTDLAASYAQTAIDINPYCEQGYLALAIHFLLNQRNEECIHALEQGLEVNPKSIDYRGAMGAMLIFAGDFENGVKILDKVVKLNSHLPWWQILSYSFYSYHRTFYADAIFWAERVNMNVAWIPLIKAAAYAQLDQPEKGRIFLDQLKRQFPFVDLSETGLKKLFSSDKIVKEVMHGVEKLGVAVIFATTINCFSLF